MFKGNKKGFTLVELLVIIAIIGILAVVAVPNLFKSIGKANISELESDYSAIRSAVLSDYADNTKLERGFGDLNNIIDYMEDIDNKTPIGGKYYIEVDEIVDNKGNILKCLNFPGYRMNADGTFNSEQDNIGKDYKMGLLIRPEDWIKDGTEESVPIGEPKITEAQFKQLVKNLGHERVYVSKKDFPEKGQEIYIGLIPK